MKAKFATLANVGSAKSPVDFGHGCVAYKRNGLWRYRNMETKRRFGRKFIDVTDHELILEMEARGYQVRFPAHECVDRPGLPCPACEMQAQRGARKS